MYLLFKMVAMYENELLYLVADKCEVYTKWNVTIIILNHELKCSLPLKYSLYAYNKWWRLEFILPLEESRLPSIIVWVSKGELGGVRRVRSGSRVPFQKRIPIYRDHNSEYRMVLFIVNRCKMLRTLFHFYFVCIHWFKFFMFIFFQMRLWFFSDGNSPGTLQFAYRTGTTGPDRVLAEIQGPVGNYWERYEVEFDSAYDFQVNIFSPLTPVVSFFRIFFLSLNFLFFFFSFMFFLAGSFSVIFSFSFFFSSPFFQTTILTSDHHISFCTTLRIYLGFCNVLLSSSFRLWL